MNIIASRLPALKFLAIAGVIQLGLTLASNVQQLKNRVQECRCSVLANICKEKLEPIRPSLSQEFLSLGTTISKKVSQNVEGSVETLQNN